MCLFSLPVDPQTLSRIKKTRKKEIQRKGKKKNIVKESRKENKITQARIEHMKEE
jgi:hypothetical protein